MARVLVIGGGASGMVASIYAAKNNNEVILIDKNNNLGKKVLITGNGKCNYWNKDISIKHYNSNNIDILDKIITDKNKLEIEKFFDRLGIVPRIKDNYYYPLSNQATSIQTSLIKEAELSGVKILNNSEVLMINKKDNKFEIIMRDNKIIADKVILATGSKASSKTGSDGIGYDIINKFGHNIIKPLPSLVQLRSNLSFMKEWHGIRCDVEIALYENNKFVKKEYGEIQLTDYGVSGICVYQLSSKVARGLDKNLDEELEINFLKMLDISNEFDFIKYMDDRNKKIYSRSVSELLDGLLNYKLVNLFLKVNKIDRDSKWNQIDDNKKKSLGIMFTRFRIKIIATNGFDSAQVCSGGVKLSEINPATMESLKQKGLYIVGELLDVDGECGGFNLGFAWISGYLAGKNI